MLPMIRHNMLKEHTYQVMHRMHFLMGLLIDHHYMVTQILIMLTKLPNRHNQCHNNPAVGNLTLILTEDTWRVKDFRRSSSSTTTKPCQPSMSTLRSMVQA